MQYEREVTALLAQEFSEKYADFDVPIKSFTLSTHHVFAHSNESKGKDEQNDKTSTKTSNEPAADTILRNKLHYAFLLDRVEAGGQDAYCSAKHFSSEAWDDFKTSFPEWAGRSWDKFEESIRVVQKFGEDLDDNSRRQKAFRAVNKYNDLIRGLEQKIIYCEQNMDEVDIYDSNGKMPRWAPWEVKRAFCNFAIDPPPKPKGKIGTHGFKVIRDDVVAELEEKKFHHNGFHRTWRAVGAYQEKRYPRDIAKKMKDFVDEMRKQDPDITNDELLQKTMASDFTLDAKKIWMNNRAPVPHQTTKRKLGREGKQPRNLGLCSRKGTFTRIARLWKLALNQLFSLSCSHEDVRWHSALRKFCPFHTIIYFRSFLPKP